MIKNKIFIICLILTLFFSMQTICAIEIDQNVSLNGMSATVEFEGTTFSELQNEINNLNDNDTIILTKDIEQDDASAIEINKNISISGKGITINAQNKSNIFNINSKVVTINNITFINGNNDKGGAIYSYADLTISNCNFIDNKAEGIYGEGGSIYSACSKLTVTQSLFEKNYASAGAAINCYASEAIIDTCQFIDNYAKWYGGAIYTDCILLVKSSRFGNNYAYSGGAIHYTTSYRTWDSITNVTINDSNFIQNTAFYGGALSTSSFRKVIYNNCNFLENYAIKGGVTYKNALAYNYFNNCSIENNSAEEGAVIYDESKNHHLSSKSYFIIENSDLKNNHDLNKSSIFYARDCNLLINNTEITNNSNNPIYNGLGDITVINSIICGNKGIFITQFYGGNVTVINNTWDKTDPEIKDIINCTNNTSVVYSNIPYSNIPMKIEYSFMFFDEPTEIPLIDTDCASTVLKINDTYIVLSHRRDGGANYNMTVHIEYQDNYIKQFKSALSYFFHTKVYTNGWAIGTGGTDAPAENEKVEALGSEIVSNGEITMEYLQQIMALKNVSGKGHFLIVNPNGTYGNIIIFNGVGEFTKIGVLGNGDYLVSPNGPTYRQEGHLDNITDPIYSNMNLSAHDRYGKNRHCVVVNSITYDGENFTDYIYASDDDGRYVDLDNRYNCDNFWFNEDYTRDVDMPIIFDKKHMGTYSTVPINTRIIVHDMLINVSEASKGFDYQITLNDGENNPLAGKKVQISFNGETYTATTDSKGIATVRLSANEGNTYNIGVRFIGDDDYAPIIGNATIEVIKQSSEFICPDYAEYDANEFTYRAILKTSTGNALTNKKVTITFNGEEQNAYTDRNGYLTIKLSVDEPGNYKIHLEFEGDESYEGTTANTYIKIAAKGNDAPVDNKENEATHHETYAPESDGENTNQTSESENSTKNASKENNGPDSIATSEGNSLGTYVLAGVALLAVIGIVIKRRNQ